MVLMCLSACLSVPPHIFYYDGCPTRPIYFGPPIFLLLVETVNKIVTLRAGVTVNTLMNVVTVVTVLTDERSSK